MADKTNYVLQVRHSVSKTQYWLSTDGDSLWPLPLEHFTDYAIKAAEELWPYLNAIALIEVQQKKHVCLIDADFLKELKCRVRISEENEVPVWNLLYMLFAQIAKDYVRKNSDCKLYMYEFAYADNMEKHFEEVARNLISFSFFDGSKIKHIESPNESNNLVVYPFIHEISLLYSAIQQWYHQGLMIKYAGYSISGSHKFTYKCGNLTDSLTNQIIHKVWDNGKGKNQLGLNCIYSVEISPSRLSKYDQTKKNYVLRTDDSLCVIQFDSTHVIEVYNREILEDLTYKQSYGLIDAWIKKTASNCQLKYLYNMPIVI